MPSTEQSLIVRHLGERRFQVQRLRDARVAEAVELVDPNTVQVEGRPDSTLMQDLRWYLERFLIHPSDPFIDIANRVQRALVQWGQQSFEQLFRGQAQDWYTAIRNTGPENLVLKISSDDPRVLAWPWEALVDPRGTTLAHTSRIERQLNDLHDPLPLPSGLSQTQINILLVIARPPQEEEIGYHAVSGPLIDWVRDERVAVQIDVLRPPTFAALRQRLAARAYHVVHFDGHGGYVDGEGVLMFEDESGSRSAIRASQLTPLLTEYRIPVMVLNACQSARNDVQDPFASTAAALLKAGIRSVVAMGYNLFVSGARQFVPAFYRRLVDSGSVAEATRAGRNAMLAHRERTSALGEHPLQDWLVPVLYQQAAVDLSVQAAVAPAEVIELPVEAKELGDYGFIGRQDAIHDIERALQRQPAAAVLIHGMAGIGKTTLVKGFLRWLQCTGGLRARDSMFVDVLWFSFDDIRGAEYVINRLVERLIGTNEMALPMDDKLPRLVKALREQPVLMVWDNFESAAGIEGTEVAPLLSEADQLILCGLLKSLRDGHSKILITSRSLEEWLPRTHAFRLRLPGLRGEDAWAFCNAVVQDLGLALDRNDVDVRALLQELDGHPLVLRSVLLQLGDVSARTLLQQLKHEFAGAEGDEGTRRIFSALALLDKGLPSSFAPVLQLIGLHQRHVDIEHVAAMLEIPAKHARREVLVQCFGTLERGGLLHRVGKGIHSMHPALHAFLGSAHAAQETGVVAFVGCMARLASDLAPRELYEQRGPFALHGANFQHALLLAVPRSQSEAGWLTYSLAVFAHNSRDLATAARLFEMLATHWSAGQPDWEATAYHHLGMIAQEQRDFALAERKYMKALTIAERQSSEHGSATYHQLGMIAQEQRDFATAERWYLKSLAIEEKQGDEGGAASTYHQLGRIAEEQHDFITAERWYLKSLAIEKKRGDEHGMMITYHQLGRITEEQRDFTTAKLWYSSSLEIAEKQDSEYNAAMTYHQLGMIALEQREFAASERWCLKSLAIKEKQCNEHGAALTYHQLGRIAHEQRDLAAAERWYMKSLAITEKHCNEYVAAMTYHQRSIIAHDQRDFAAAERWCLKSLAIKNKQGNMRGLASSYHQLGTIAQARGDFVAAECWYMQSLAIAEKQGDERLAAITCHALGHLAELQEDIASAAHHYLAAIQGYAKTHDQHWLPKALNLFLACHRSAGADLQDALRARWQSMGLDPLISAELEKSSPE